MKKTIAMLLIVMMLIGTMSAFAATYIYSTGNVNIRTGPGLGYKIIGSVSKGTALTYAGTTGLDNRNIAWYKVYYGSGTGWISSTYASTTPGGGGSSVTYYVKATAQTYLRKGPTLNYSTVGAMSNGDMLMYTGQTSTDNRNVKWYQVIYKGGTAWVSSKYTVLTTKGGGGSSSTRYICATGGDTYVRSGAGLDYKKLKTMPKGATATYLGVAKTDNRGVAWYKVTYKGTTGWVSSKYTTVK